MSGGGDYTVAQCKGCDFVSYQERSWSSEDYRQDGSQIITVGRYPPKTLRSKPDWYSDFFLQLAFDDDSPLRLYDEIYIAMQNNCRSLAIMGIRALLERIMIVHCGDHGTFKKNIDQFENDGFISPKQKSAIIPVLDAGHASIHRAFEPKTNELIAALDITENIIESIYINEAKAMQLDVPEKGGR